MTAPRRGWMFAVAVGALWLADHGMAAAQTTPLPKPRPAVAGKAAITSDTRVYLLRGLLNIFSLGMDTLAEKLNALGIKAEVYNHDSWTSVASEIGNDYKRGQQNAVVLIGHSLGADVVFVLAERLDKENIPVKLVVLFDPTGSYEISKNVGHLLNFYQHNGFGRRVTAGAGFRGELNNMDLTKDESIGHGSIDKSSQLHDLTIAKIRQVATKSPPRKRRAPAKPKPAIAANPAAEKPAGTSPAPASPRS